MRTIAVQSASYEKDVVPAGAPPAQRIECRRAFYAGAQAMLGIVQQLGDDSVSEDAGVAVLEGLAVEGQIFVGEVLAGRA